MPDLVTSIFDDDWIKNEQAGKKIPFSYYKSMGNVLDAQGQLTVVSGLIWPKFKLVWDLMHVLIICNNRERVETSFFPHC